MKPTEQVEPIVEGDDNDVANSRKVCAVVQIFRAATYDVTSAVDVHLNVIVQLLNLGSQATEIFRQQSKRNVFIGGLVFKQI